jgi:hypothetical protein
MKKQLKAVLAGFVAAAAMVTSSQAASGDLIVGFFKPGSPNTYVFNLGQFSALTQGENWNLASGLTGAGFGSLNGVSFGVVGYNNTGSILYSTDASGSPDFTGVSSFSSTRGTVDTMNNNSGSQAVGSGPDWWNETINPVGAGTWIANTQIDPNTVQPNGATLYRGNASGTVLESVSSFTFSTSGTLTYGIAVPEPSACSLLGGFGVLLLAFRHRQFLKA